MIRRAYAEAWHPGTHSANVFLLDGNLDRRSNNLREGAIIAHTLFHSIASPFYAIINEAKMQLRQQGMTRSEVEQIIAEGAVLKNALNILHSKALLAGISRTPEGGIGFPAQIPHTNYQTVGGIVYNNALAASVRNKLEKEKRKAEQRAVNEARRQQTSERFDNRGGNL